MQDQCPAANVSDQTYSTNAQRIESVLFNPISRVLSNRYYKQRGAVVKIQSLFRMGAARRLVVLMRRRFRLSGMSSSLIYMRTCLLLNCRPNSKLMTHLHLQNCFEVTVLDFSQNFLGDRGILCCLSVIRQSFKMRTLKLASNGIRNQGAIALAMALRKHPNVTDVDLSKNAISDTGGRALLVLLKQNRRVRRLELDGKLEPRLRLQIKAQAAKNQQWVETKATVKATKKRRGKVRAAGESMVRYEARGEDSDLEDGEDEDEDEDERGPSSEIGTLMACREQGKASPFIFSAILQKLTQNYSSTAEVEWSPLDKQLMRSSKLRKAVGIWWITFVTPKDNGSQHGLSKPEFVLLYQGISRLLCGDDVTTLKQRQQHAGGSSGIGSSSGGLADELLEEGAGLGEGEQAFDPYDNEYELDDALTEISEAGEDMMHAFDISGYGDSVDEEDESSMAEKQQMQQETQRLLQYVKRQMQVRSRRRAYEEALTQQAEGEWVRLTTTQDNKKMSKFQRKKRKGASSQRKYLGVEALAEGVICLALYLTRSNDAGELAGAGSAMAGAGSSGSSGAGSGNERNAAEEAEERLRSRERGCLDFLDWIFPAIFSAEFRAMPSYAHGRHRVGSDDAAEEAEEETSSSSVLAEESSSAVSAAGQAQGRRLLGVMLSSAEPTNGGSDKEVPVVGVVGGRDPTLTVSSSWWPCTAASSAFRAAPQCSSVSAAHLCSRRALLVSARLHKLITVQDVTAIVGRFRQRALTAANAAAAAAVAGMLFQSSGLQEADVSNRGTVSELAPEVANDNVKVGWNVFSQVMRPFIQAALDRNAANPFTKAVVAAAEQKAQEKAVNAVDPTTTTSTTATTEAAAQEVQGTQDSREAQRSPVVKRRDSLLDGFQATLLGNQQQQADEQQYYEDAQEEDADDLLDDGLQMGMLVLARFGKGRVWKAATVEDVHADGSCILLYKEEGGEAGGSRGRNEDKNGGGSTFGDREVEANVPRFRVKREGQLSRRRLSRGERVDVAFKGKEVLYGACVERVVEQTVGKNKELYDIKYEDGESEKGIQRCHIFAQEGRVPEAGAAAVLASKPLDSASASGKGKGAKRVGFVPGVDEHNGASLLAAVADLSGVGGGGSTRYITRRIFDILRVNDATGTQEGPWVNWHDAVMLLYVTADDESKPNPTAGAKAKQLTKAKAFQSLNALRLALQLATENTEAREAAGHARLGQVMVSKAMLRRVIHQCGAPASSAIVINEQTVLCQHPPTVQSPLPIIDVVCAALALMTRPRTFPLLLTDPEGEGDCGCAPPISCEDFLLLLEEQHRAAWEAQVDLQTRSVQLKHTSRASDHEVQLETHATPSLPSFMSGATAVGRDAGQDNDLGSSREVAAKKSKQPARPAAAAPKSRQPVRRQRQWQKQLEKQQETQRQRQLTWQQQEEEAGQVAAERTASVEVKIGEEAAALLQAGALAEALVGGRPAVAEAWATMRRDAKEASWTVRQTSSTSDAIGAVPAPPPSALLLGASNIADTNAADAAGADAGAMSAASLIGMWDRSAQSWRWMLPGIDEDEGTSEMRGREGARVRRATVRAGAAVDTSARGANRSAERARQQEREAKQRKRFAEQLKLWRDAERTIRQSRRQVGVYKFRHTQMGGRDGGGARSVAYGAAGLTNTSYAAGRMTMMEQYGGRAKQHQRFKGRNPFTSGRDGANGDGGGGAVDPWRGMVTTLLIGAEDCEDDDGNCGSDAGDVGTGVMQAHRPHASSRKTIAQRVSTIGGRHHRRSSIGGGRVEAASAPVDASNTQRRGTGAPTQAGGKRLSMRQRYTMNSGSAGTDDEASAQPSSPTAAASAARDKTRRRLSARLSVDMGLGESQLASLREHVMRDQQRQEQEVAARTLATSSAGEGEA
jgi:hypothetical protein